MSNQANEAGAEARYIDLTPSWQAAVRIYMAAIRSNKGAKQAEMMDMAEQEFMRMAAAIDQMNAQSRKEAA